MNRSFQMWSNIDVNDVHFSLSKDKNGKQQIAMYVGQGFKDLSLLTPPCVTQWPRCTGEGNFGTTYGPADPSKAKFTLDLHSLHIAGEENVHWKPFADFLTAVDNKLLDFVFENQDKIFKGKSLTREQIGMLQIRTVKEKMNSNGQFNSHAVDLKRSINSYNSLGYQAKTEIQVCDASGAPIEGGVVRSGDVVSATMWVQSVYTGVGGDKFGISYAFGAVSVIAQRAKLENKTTVSAFSDQSYSFATAYEMPA